eukprot:13426660-Alexandrium_andersonii.AAC.1
MVQPDGQSFAPGIPNPGADNHSHRIASAANMRGWRVGRLRVRQQMFWVFAPETEKSWSRRLMSPTTASNVEGI